MRRHLLVGLSLTLLVVGVLFLALSAYEMYTLGTSPDVDDANTAKRGIATAVIGATLSIVGLAIRRMTHGDEDPPAPPS